MKLSATSESPNGTRELSSSSSLSAQPISSPQDQGEPGSSLLNATQLTTMNPTSFICASCSLPLILSSRVNLYRDLPSEHWEELVEAWMCHADQQLSDQVKKFTGKGEGTQDNGVRRPRGFWPAKGQALVGGSYVLFEGDAMNRGNLFIGSEVKVRDYFHHFSFFLLYHTDD